MYPKGSVTFITLTYDDEHLPADVAEAKKQYQDFCRRLRKEGVVFRYLASLERGDLNGRLHWHAILFGVPFTQVNNHLIKNVWRNGFIKWRLAAEGEMHYVMKYVLKSRVLRHEGKDYGCILMSRRPGIGAARVEDLQKLVGSLSEMEVRKLRGQSDAVLRPNEKRSLRAMRVGGKYLSLHRYYREQLLIPESHPDITVVEDIVSGKIKKTD